MPPRVSIESVDMASGGRCTRMTIGNEDCPADFRSCLALMRSLPVLTGCL